MIIQKRIKFETELKNIKNNLVQKFIRQTKKSNWKLLTTNVIFSKS